MKKIVFLTLMILGGSLVFSQGAPTPPSRLVTLEQAWDLVGQAPWEGAAWESLQAARKAEGILDPGPLYLPEAPRFFWAFLLSGVLLFLGLGGLALRVGKKGSRGLGKALALLGLMVLLPLGIHWAAGDRFTARLIEPAQPLAGDGDFFPPAWNRSWKEGQELVVLLHRPGWVQVLAGGVIGWVPEGSLKSTGPE